MRVVEVKEPPVDPPAEGRGEGEVLNGGGRAEGTGADDPRESEDEPRRRPRGGTVRSSRLAVSRGRASRGSGSVGNRCDDVGPKSEAAGSGRPKVPEDDDERDPPGMGLGDGLEVDRSRLREGRDVRRAGDDELPGGGSLGPAEWEVAEVDNMFDVAVGRRSARGVEERPLNVGNNDRMTRRSVTGSGNGTGR